MIFPKVNFIGNKEKLAGWICDNIPNNVVSFFDAFSGGASVSFEAKKRGLKVISNDIMTINYLIAKAIIQNKETILTHADLERIFKGKPKKGYMYKHYSNKIFYPEECMELDLYRDNIEKLNNSYKKSLGYLMIRRAMIRKMPYSRFTIPWPKIIQLRDEEFSYNKYGRKRAYHNLTFKQHMLENIEQYNKAVFDNGQKNKAINKNVFDLLDKIEADAIYIDPPYANTLNDYYAFYNPIDELILQNEIPRFQDNFLKKSDIIFLFEKLFSKLGNYKYWLISYNNKSYPNKALIVSMLNKHAKKVTVLEKEHNYQITGKNNKKNNKEYLFIAENI